MKLDHTLEIGNQLEIPFKSEIGPQNLDELLEHSNLVQLQHCNRASKLLPINSMEGKIDNELLLDKASDMSEDAGSGASSLSPMPPMTKLSSSAAGSNTGATAAAASGNLPEQSLNSNQQYRADPWVITTGPAHSSLRWHEKVYHHMHSHRVHVVLMVLLGLDVLISIISVILEVEYLKSEINDYEHIIDVCQEAVTSGDASAASYCLSHGEVGSRRIEGGQEALAVLSLIILFIFLLESTILLASNP
jgi:hypothetical protein